MKLKGWVACLLIAAGVIGSIVLVHVLGLEDSSRSCGRGGCASGTAIIASAFFMFGLLLFLMLSDKVADFQTRRAVKRIIAANPELQDHLKDASPQKMDLTQITALQKGIKATKEEARYQEFRRKVEEDRQRRLKGAHNGPSRF
ncbi:hypothetical protein [Microvirga aerophila]|uniref:Uncharacterized protein n=1 Tax=Microvirga aerophila TaxID=670291 RepID=A0A512BNI4_9HYPH|nr:hypothetical protein [Microvirga aerophila]GEO13521.1 hypothetical protein MAE02_12170 [Microvirga aerophila]